MDENLFLFGDEKTPTNWIEVDVGGEGVTIRVAEPDEKGGMIAMPRENAVALAKWILERFGLADDGAIGHSTPVGAVREGRR
jgi:hypothetical protein